MTNKELFVQYLPKLRKYAYRLTKDRMQTDDLIQDSFLKIATQTDLANGIQYFYNAIDYAYTSGIVYKHAAKRDSRVTVALEDYEPTHTPYYDLDIDVMLSVLTDKQADIVRNVLYIYDNMAEYARDNGLKENTVKANYMHAIKKLRKKWL